MTDAELFVTISSAVISLITLIYLFFSERRNSITSTITKERVDWIRQAREALLKFADCYYRRNKKGMRQAKARLETLMRRDTPEYRLVLEHIDICINSNELDLGNYNKLIGLSSYILARAWQRVKIDGLRLRTGNRKKNTEVTNQVSSLLVSVVNGTYMDIDPLTEYSVISKCAEAKGKKNNQYRVSHKAAEKIEAAIKKPGSISECCVLNISKAKNKKEIMAFAVLNPNYSGKKEQALEEIQLSCQMDLKPSSVPKAYKLYISDRFTPCNHIKTRLVKNGRTPTMPKNKLLTGYPSIDKPWLKFYSEDKRSFEIPDCSVYDYMREHNQDNLDSTALDYFGAKVSYHELIARIEQCAEAFAALGVKCGDVVSFCNPTTPEIYYAFYALNKLGAIANMIDPRTNASRIEEFIIGTDSKIVFYIDIAYPKIKDILARKEIQSAICISAADSLPFLLKLGYKLKNRIPADKKPPQSGKYLSWSQFFDAGSKSSAHTAPQDKAVHVSALPAGIIYTSGTTGIPKGAILTNQNLLAMVMQNICADIGWEKNDRFLGIMPPFIAYGLVCGFTLPLCLGMRVTIIPKFEVEQFDSYILKHRPHHIMGVPSYIEKLMYSEKIQKTDLSFLKTVIVGGDKMNPETEVVINDFLKQHHSSCRVIKGYGLSEMSSNAVFPRNNECNKIGSVGTPLVGNNLKIINSETGAELGYNEVGEICLTGPTLIDGYWHNEEENCKVFKIENGVRWIHTGDRGYIDEDGVVFFNDRVKRIIVRSDGHNVWPSDSERIIEKHPCIDGCCVVGVPDVKAGHGEIVTAFIVLKRDSGKTQDQVVEELKADLLNNLPTRDVPLQYYVLPELPLSGVGKVDYRALEGLAKEDTHRV